MNIEEGNGPIRVTLSVRNVEELLTLHAAALKQEAVAVLYRLTDRGWLELAVEADELHYKDRVDDDEAAGVVADIDISRWTDEGH